MLIKNVRMIMDRIIKPLQLKSWIRSRPAVIFLGSCALLFGAPLYAQDLLLKEYIYLNGRLLAVERQMLTQAAQQPASNSGKEMEFAQYLPFGIHGLTPPGNSCKPGISAIPGMQEMCAFHSPVLAQTLQCDAYRRHWKVEGVSEHKYGGCYDGL